MAEREAAEHHGDDRRPAVQRHPDMRREQAPGDDLHHEPERRGEGDGGRIRHRARLH
jgi:hypothetical protein